MIAPALVTTEGLVTTHPALDLEPSWRARALANGVSWLLALYHRAEVDGIEALPRDRPLLYVAKHPHSLLYTETLLLASAVQQAGLVPFWRFDPGPGSSLLRPPAGWPLPPLGLHGQRGALAALRAGESLLVFPGGTRELHGAPDVISWRGRRGYARLAALTSTPVVPVAIEGADQQHPWSLRMASRRVFWIPPVPLPVRLVYRFGAPIAPPARRDPASLSGFAEEVAHATRVLLARSRSRRKR